LRTILIGCFAFLVALGLSWFRWPLPAIHDEFSYLLSADTLLSGRFANPAHQVWPVFQAEHVIAQPSYASKYPLGPASLLALGKLLLGTPTGGLWLGAAAASAAAAWMLRGLVSWRWAFLGGVLVALHPNMQTVWSQSYMNGWLTTCMACLSLGGALRLRRRWSSAHALAMSVGMGGLALCRPWEGFLSASFAVVLWLSSPGFRRHWSATCWSQKISNSLAFIPIAASLVLIVSHNQQVTGSWCKMPYQLHEEQYGVAPLSIFQSPKSPKLFRLDHGETGTESQPSSLVPIEIQRYHKDWSMDCYRESIGLLGWSRSCLESLGVCTQFFGISFGFLPWIAWLACRRTRVVVLMSMVSLAMLLASTFIPWVLPHYFAPMLPWLICLSILTLRGLVHRCFAFAPRRVSIGRAQASLAMLQLLMLVVGAVLLTRAPYLAFASDRNAIHKKLLALDGKHLVLVRYAADHNVHEEWVYNQADLDSSPIVWARSWRADFDQQVVEAYSDRKIWILEPDESINSLREFKPEERTGYVALVRPL
jgi:hypothetical protein